MSTCPFLSKLPWVAEIQVLTRGGMLWSIFVGPQADKNLLTAKAK